MISASDQAEYELQKVLIGRRYICFTSFILTAQFINYNLQRSKHDEDAVDPWIIILRIFCCSLIWLGIFLSYCKKPKYVLWSFIPIYIWRLSVMLALKSVVDIEDVNTRHYQISATVGVAIETFFHSIIISEFCGKFRQV